MGRVTQMTIPEALALIEVLHLRQALSDPRQARDMRANNPLLISGFHALELLAKEGGGPGKRKTKKARPA